MNPASCSKASVHGTVKATALLQIIQHFRSWKTKLRHLVYKNTGKAFKQYCMDRCIMSELFGCCFETSAPTKANSTEVPLLTLLSSPKQMEKGTSNFGVTRDHEPLQDTLEISKAYVQYRNLLGFQLAWGRQTSNNFLLMLGKFSNLRDALCSNGLPIVRTR